MTPISFVSLVRTSLVASLLGLSSCALPTGTKFRTSQGSERQNRDGTVERRAVVETATEDGRSYSGINDVARFFAGMPGGRNSVLTATRSRDQWARHAENINSLWRMFEAARQDAINSWSSQALGSLRRPATLLYPFSGPDFLYADAFFPGAQTYLFSGLETCESLPNVAEMDEDSLIEGLNGLYTSLSTSLSASFFITKDMKVDLQRTAFKGTLPILMTFMARTGHSIESVEYVALAANGGVVPRGADGSNTPGLKMTFRGAGIGGQKTLYYFTTDLSDETYNESSRYGRFVRGFGPVVTFVKSASYLMHESYFSNIRNTVLSQSTAILQDDSGVPLRRFDRSQWDVRHYGTYSGVLDIFTKYYQSDLAEAHNAGAEPLGFGIGYKHLNGQSALILGLRR